MEVIGQSETGDELISVIILAAGSSSRMGQSKQLLLIENEPLLLRSIKATLTSSFENIVVVLGAEEEKHRVVIEHLPVQIIHNQNWANGMGSSLKAGLNHLLKLQSDLGAVIIAVCDQPLLSAAHIDKIVETFHQTNKPIVASRYTGVAGVPALFDQSMFSELLDLPDEQGAKKLITKYESTIETIDFPEGAIDLDTWSEYEDFRNKIN
jgi:molybdenum cofactor cytidylyltransferase